MALRVFILFSFAVLALIASAPHATHAQAALTVKGQVVNGTAGGGSVQGLVVIFHQHTPVAINDLEQTLGPDGQFSFENILFDAQTAYGVSVDYQGAVYGIDLDLSPGVPPPIELRVYESLQDDSIISAAAVSVLFTQAEKASQTVQVLEIVRITNKSDRTYIPGPQPMQLLRFGLPDGAFNLQVDTGIQPAEFFQVDLGFAVSASVPPGEHEILYSYSVPYSGDTLFIEKHLAYGAGQLRVVAPEGLFEFDAGTLGEPEPTNVGGAPYNVLERVDISRGTRVSLTITDLPQATFGERVGRTLDNMRWELAAPVTLGVVLVGVIGFFAFRAVRGRRDAEPGARFGATPADEREAVLNMLAELDDDREDGFVNEEEYRRRRSLLTARLADAHRRADGEPGEGQEEKEPTST